MHGVAQIKYEKVVSGKMNGSMQIRYEKVVTRKMHDAIQIRYKNPPKEARRPNFC